LAEPTCNPFGHAQQFSYGSAPDMSDGGMIILITDLIPWGRNHRPVATRFGEVTDPFVALSRHMNQILDDFTRGFGVSLPGPFGRSGTCAAR
jgi:hypothetical protein